MVLNQTITLTKKNEPLNRTKPNRTVNYEPNRSVSVLFQNCWLWFSFGLIFRFFCPPLFMRALIECGVRNFLDIEPNNILSHAQIFSGLHMHFLKIKNIFKVIWLAIIWMILEARNDPIFNQEVFMQIMWFII
jgi:hypothetical protein